MRSAKESAFWLIRITIYFLIAMVIIFMIFILFDFGDSTQNVFAMFFSLSLIIVLGITLNLQNNIKEEKPVVDWANLPLDRRNPHHQKIFATLCSFSESDFALASKIIALLRHLTANNKHTTDFTPLERNQFENQLGHLPAYLTEFVITYNKANEQSVLRVVKTAVWLFSNRIIS